MSKPVQKPFDRARSGGVEWVGRVYKTTGALYQYTGNQTNAPTGSSTWGEPAGQYWYLAYFNLTSSTLSATATPSNLAHFGQFTPTDSTHHIRGGTAAFPSLYTGADEAWSPYPWSTYGWPVATTISHPSNLAVLDTNSSATTAASNFPTFTRLRNAADTAELAVKIPQADSAYASKIDKSGLSLLFWRDGVTISGQFQYLVWGGIEGKHMRYNRVSGASPVDAYPLGTPYPATGSYFSVVPFQSFVGGMSYAKTSEVLILLWGALDDTGTFPRGSRVLLKGTSGPTYYWRPVDVTGSDFAVPSDSGFTDGSLIYLTTS